MAPWDKDLGIRLRPDFIELIILEVLGEPKRRRGFRV